jgi:spore germination protein KC
MRQLTSRLPLVILLCFSLALSGCWNSRELNDLAIVIGMGIDWLPKAKQFRVSFQVVNPSIVSPGMKSGGGKGDSPIIVYSETENTLYSALRKASQRVSRQLFFSHTQLLVIGEPLAKKGIGQLFDFFDRSHEFRLNTPVIISRGDTAENLLRTITPLEKATAGGIAKRLRVTESVWAHSVYTEVRDVITALSGTGDFALSGIRNKKNTKTGGLEIQGIGVIKKGKLTGWLHGNRTVGILIVRNEIKSTILDLYCRNQKDTISAEMVKSEAQLKVTMKSGMPAFHIRIKEEGNVNEVHCPLDLDNKKTMVDLQQQWAKKTKLEVTEAINAAKKDNSDIIGFGDAVKRAAPAQWKSMEKNWGDVFPRVKFDVQVEALLRHTGMRSNSYIPKK